MSTLIPIGKYHQNFEKIYQIRESILQSKMKFCQDDRRPPTEIYKYDKING